MRLVLDFTITLIAALIIAVSFFIVGTALAQPVELDEVCMRALAEEIRTNPEAVLSEICKVIRPTLSKKECFDTPLKVTDLDKFVIIKCGR